MKLFLLICSILSVAVAQQEPSLSCRYFNFDQTYGCELTIINPNGFNNFTEIDGIHLAGFTNEDVNSIYRRSGSTPNLPQIICETFPNIAQFDFFNSGLTEIDNSAFSGCSRITQLFLNFNRINSISANAFLSLGDIRYLNLGDNLLSTLPDSLFASQQNLTDLSLAFNRFNDIPVNLFRPLENLQYLVLSNANLTSINNQWFTGNTRLSLLMLDGNSITLSANSFVGLDALLFLSLAFNNINEIPSGTFTGLPNLRGLELYGNRFTVLQADSFPDLGQLAALDISFNPIETIDGDAFRGLESLTSLYMAECRIRELNPNSFNRLGNLTYIDLNFNEIEDILPGTFASMPNLDYIGLWNNRLKTLRRNAFGTLTALRTLDLDGNIVNALDRVIIDDAVNLLTLYFEGNLCASNYFGNFLVSRAQHLRQLERCFSNMRFVIDTTTESDGVYSFFEGPRPGIALRVRSNNEVQIALTPFNFMWSPAIEIFIGSTNNTRSVIRRNQETDVVTVPTPNIVRQNQWNDFRVTWANQNVLVFAGNDSFPFMSYTMQDFVPVNFYGLRAVETTATWSVQPFQ